jgi:hypothetical protein
MPKYIDRCINGYDKKKQQPRGIPDSIQPGITPPQSQRSEE